VLSFTSYLIITSILLSLYFNSVLVEKFYFKMNQKVVLIISLLSSSLALSNATNNEQKYVDSTESLRVSKRESPLEQLFPSLSLNRLQNGTIFLPEINSAIHYANSTIQRVIDETRKLLNLTSDQYNANEIAVIMAYPRPNISHNSNESEKILNNSSSNENQSYGLNEVKDGLNFSGRFLDLNELLSLIQTPLNILGHNNLLRLKTPITTPATYYEPTYKQVYEEAYPAVPVVPVKASVSYEVPAAPVQYEAPKAPVQYEAPKAPVSYEVPAYEEPKAPVPYEVPAYEAPKAPVSYEVPEAPQVAYEAPKAPVPYEVPEAPQVAYEEPKAPQYSSVSAMAGVEYKPQAVPYK
jgi:hypothetical protein